MTRSFFLCPSWVIRACCLLLLVSAGACDNGGSGTAESDSRAATLIPRSAETASRGESSTGESVEQVVVEAVAVPFDSSDPDAQGSPSLLYRSGLWLKSEGEHFGGFSGLLIEDGVLTAASDRGWWWQASLVQSADGTLVGLTDHRQLPILDLDGAPVQKPADRHDAEELLPTPAGLAVSFEREHRIQLYAPVVAPSDAPAAWSTAINDRAPRPFEAPPGLELAGENRGLEAMAPLTGDRALLLLEAAVEPEGDIPGWIRGRAGEWLPLSLVPTEDFAPTAADTLPNGDVIIVERSYTPETGTRVRISWFPDSEIRPGARLRPHELLRLAPPQTVDNFEALSVAQGPSGEHYLYLLSDDNFSAEQRTLLLQFELGLDSLPHAVKRSENH